MIISSSGKNSTTTYFDDSSWPVSFYGRAGFGLSLRRDFKLNNNNNNIFFIKNEILISKYILVI